MRRIQRLIFSALLTLMMALHATGVLLETSPSDLSWLSIVGVGVSALVGAAALGLFVWTWGTQADGVSFSIGNRESRTRSIWWGIGCLILCLLGTSVLLVLARSMGIGSAQLGQFIDMAAAVYFPVGGSIALLGLLRNAPARRVDRV
jgi:hypothetical protein